MMLKCLTAHFSKWDSLAECKEEEQRRSLMPAHDGRAIIHGLPALLPIQVIHRRAEQWLDSSHGHTRLCCGEAKREIAMMEEPSLEGWVLRTMEGANTARLPSPTHDLVWC
ncbi:hypothetical protein NMY22_g5547 [Coprinellus aureogranulatus]|nr:hypothetical protein NMY22_g5547 [Coprinellus aureogranulatus]